MKRVTPFVLLLFTLSGTSGLIYEIVWIRLLSYLLGGTSYAISTVLAAFMGGLALGSRFYGARADRCERPLRLYAHLELGSAALALLVYALIALAPPVYVRLAHLLPGPALAVMRVLIALLLLVPPTFLMGGTLPVLSRFIVQSQDRLGRGLGLLYGVNTFGAVLGSFLAGFALVALLGLAGSTALALALNLLIAVLILLIDRGLPPMSVPAAKEAGATAMKPADGKTAGAEDEPAEMNWGLLALIFALSGFASLGYELYWTRGLQHFLGNSTYAFSTMLTTFLLGLAVGGWLGGRLVDRVRVPSRLLGWIQIGIGATVLATVLLIWEWLPRLQDSAFLTHRSMNWNSYVLRRFLVAAAVMSVPTFLTGMTFPVVNRIGIRNLTRLGRGVGGLYFSNTIGAILGSLVAGFLILPLIGAKNALIATGVFSALLGVVVHMGSRRRGAFEPWLVLLVFFGLAATTPLLRDSGQKLLSDTQDEADRVVFSKEDHAGETKIYRKAASSELHMSVDGHHIGGTEPGIVRKEKILAHMPMLLAPEAKRTLSIGLGSGLTLGTLAFYEEIEELSVVEIVPGVVEGARLFRKYHGDVLRDPRVRVHVGDGVQFLLTTRDRYDIISSDSKLNPEFSGNAPLLSRDYYELCRNRLSEDGLMVQWLAIHLPNSELEIIMRSFVEAFPYAALYWMEPYSFILAGSNRPLALDMDAAREFIRRENLADDFKLLHLDDPYIVASLFQADRERLASVLGEGPVNTWQRPRLEFSLAREFRRKPTPYHEDETLLWLQRVRKAKPQIVRGDYDAEKLERFYASESKLLEAFASGGGISRLETGVDQLKEGLEINPDDKRMSVYLTSLQIAEEDLEEAFESGRITTPEDLVRVGLLRLDDGRFEEALALFDEAFEMKPEDSSIQYNRLRTLRELGRWEAMEEALKRFREEFPRDARGFSMQGRLYANRGEFEKALAEFEEALERDPGNPVFVNNLATSLARLNRFGDAGESFAKVCELDPTYPEAAFFAAASFSMANRNEEAAHWVRFCIERGLAEPSSFTEDMLFANLRESEFWDPSLLE